MNIPPFLEKLLLSNEAVFKNASLGLSGQNFIPVPKGKTAVILEINIEPFFNCISEDVNKIFDLGSAELDPQTAWDFIKERLFFQLQIINDNYQTYFNFQNDFDIDLTQDSQGAPKLFYLKTKFKGWKEEVFIYTDRGLYFNFIYPHQDFNNKTGIIIDWGNPLNDFLPTEQNLPPQPTTFYKSANLNFAKYVYTNNNPQSYYSPTNRNVNGLVKPLKEFFQIQADFLGSIKNSIIQPQVSLDETEFQDLLRLPFLNIKYALINKRASDYGLTVPGK